MLSPNELVKEIAKQLDNNIICFVNKADRSIEVIELDDLSEAEVSERTALFEAKSSSYIKVPPMPTQVLQFAMEEFLGEVTDAEVEKELGKALQRKNPTRNFLQVVNSRFDIKQHWRNFKREKNIEFVGKQFIKDYNY